MHMHTRHGTRASSPTVTDFKSEAQGNAVLKWRDLPLGVFKILSKHTTHNKFGQSMILELEDANGVVYLSWAPARLVDRLTNDTAINFVLNEGLRQSVSDPSMSFFAFSTVRARAG